MKRQDDDGDTNVDSGSKKPRNHPRDIYLRPCPRRRPRIGDEFQAVIQPALIRPDHEEENANEEQRGSEDTIVTEEEGDVNGRVEHKHTGGDTGTMKGDNGQAESAAE